MFTDLVGYTALTQADERQALAVLERHHRLLRPTFPRHHGREVKTMGDSFLVEFDSALDAVECALEIQQLLQEYNDSSVDAWKIQVRIGIHLGDVEHLDGDVLGDAVNIASRLEPLAEPGGVCVSDPVFGQVRNKLEVEFEKLAPQQLKNVRFPVSVYKVTKPPKTLAGRPSGPPAHGHRLAVLPFANLSPDPQDEFFADGLTEEMITELSHLPGLQVIARTSVMRFKRTEKGMKDVGRELGVDLALEGSVRKAANRIRITAQLIDIATESHLWSDRFDRDLTDIFALQSEISQSVAKRLGVSLGSDASGNRPAPTRLDAYFLYLKGRSLWNRRTEAAVLQALKNFEAAAAQDPKFAQAYSGIADCLLILLWNFERLPWSEGGSRAKAAALKAVELDDGLAEAHASLGLVHEQDFAWRDADRELQRAIALNPGYAPAHLWLSRSFASQGRMEEAEAEALTMAQYDPLSPVGLMNRAGFLAARGEIDAATRLWDSIVELEPSFGEWVLLVKVMSLTDAGRVDESKEAFRPFAKAWTDAGARLEERITWIPAVVWGILGDRGEAQRSLERLVEVAQSMFVPARGFSYIYAALGDDDRFFEWANRSIEDRSVEPIFLRQFPLFGRYRSDPRYAKLFQRIGAPA